MGAEHYILYERIANELPFAHIVVPCDSLLLRAPLKYWVQDYRWTVVVDPDELVTNGTSHTEHGHYLRHIVLFWKQLAPLQVFVHDDAEDLTVDHPKDDYHRHTLNLLESLKAVHKAVKQPNFLYMSKGIRGFYHTASITNRYPQVAGRCKLFDSLTGGFDKFVQKVMLPHRSPDEIPAQVQY